MNSQRPKKPASKNKQLSAYGRYSSLALQIVIVVIAFAWSGMKLDEWMSTEIPVWTVSMTGVGIVGALFYLYKSVTKDT